ncbi:uncharacterized protein VTP21DRAFT_1162 [Calcarisporiella thermophila]|uniref:uncharacterized protein n=1 Tax=Calcarisporiella thermophila TaxID=911321 RepID=UPI0037442073
MTDPSPTNPSADAPSHIPMSAHNSAPADGRDNGAGVHVKESMEKLAEVQDTTHYRVYPIRFFGLALIFLLNLSNNMNWVTFSSVPLTTKAYYGADDTMLTIFAMVYMIVFIFIAWPSAYIFRRFGIKYGLIIGAVLNAVGAWIRYFGSFSGDRSTAYSVAMFGQVVAAAGQPFFLDVPALYSNTWFSERGRATATLIGSIGNMVGVAVANLIVPLIATEVDTFPHALVALAVIATVFAIPAFFVPAKPPTPPSVSAQVPHDPYMTGLRNVLRNRNFWILALVFAFFVGIFSALSALFNLAMTPYGYSETEAGIAMIVLIIVGLVGALVTSMIVDRTKRHKLVFRLATPITGVLVLLLIVSVKRDNLAGIIVHCALIGIALTSLLPVGLELGVECTYPVSEATSSATLWMGSQLVSIIFLVVMDKLGDPDGEPRNNQWRGLLFLGIAGLFASVVAQFYRGQNRRMESERNAITHK